MKSLKSKIAVGVVTVSMLSGVGAVFASTDAGAELATWYDAQFKTTTAQAWKNVESYFNGKVPALTTWFNIEKNTAKADVVDAQVAEISRASQEINDAKQAYIDSLNTEQTDIKAAMPGQFETFVNEKKTYIDNTGNTVKGWANNEIAKAVNNQGDASVTAVSTEVTGVKSAALKALEQAIADAKAALNGALSEQQGLAETDLKDYLDAKIDTLKKEIEAATDTLVQQKQAAIAAEGSAIETSAISEMDAMVDAIDGQVTASQPQ